MKRYILKAAFAVFIMAGLQSCMDFDVPGDELTGNDEKGEDVVYHGQADIIDYKKEISEEGFKEAESALGNYLDRCLRQNMLCAAVKKEKSLCRTSINISII